MENFELFYERRERNPLRKQELAQLNYDNKAYADDIIREWERNIPQRIKDTYNILLKRDPKKAEEYLMGERQKEYQSHLKTKIGQDDYKLIFDKHGVKFYLDKKDLDKMNSQLISSINHSLRTFVDTIKDILPLRKPKIVIGDNRRNNKTNINKTGVTQVPAAYYYDGIIYIDIDHVDDPDLLVHEYAHLLADRISSQSKQLLQKGYSNMIDNFFKGVKKKKQDKLEGLDNDKWRKAVAKKLGLPSPYAFTNADEWFAEIITHWKKIPNNVVTYKFKQAVKSILTRL